MPHIALPEGLPGITSGFAFRPETAKPMRELAEVLLRGPNTLTSGEREMIAAFVSSRNDCEFCHASHRAAAAHHLDGNYDLVDAVSDDYQTAPVSSKLKALLAIAGKVQQGGKQVTAQDVERARAEGATDLEIHDTVLIAAAFCMYNRYVDGLATCHADRPGRPTTRWASAWQRRAMSAPAHSENTLYLPGVEAHPQPGVYQDLIAAARGRNAEYSKIWDLFAFQQTSRSTSRASRRACCVSPRISPGLRELIAAYTSYQNECAFCTKAHAAAASELLGDEALVWGALRDLEHAPLDEKEKLLLRFVGKVTKNLPGIQRRRRRRPARRPAGTTRRSTTRSRPARSSISTTAGSPPRRPRDVERESPPAGKDAGVARLRPRLSRHHATHRASC